MNVSGVEKEVGVMVSAASNGISSTSHAIEWDACSAIRSSESDIARCMQRNQVRAMQCGQTYIIRYPWQ